MPLVCSDLCTFRNGKIFLRNCINEKAIPISTFNVLKSFHFILPECIILFIEFSVESLTFSEDSTSEKARFVEIDLYKKKFTGEKTTKKLRMEISDLNNTLISKLGYKLGFLCC